MDEILERSLLYDFYGELLTQKQRDVYKMVVFDDLTYSEAAQIAGISRQGVYDIVRRTQDILVKYEGRLGLVARFARTRGLAQRLAALSLEFENTHDPQLAAKIGELSRQIAEVLL